MQRLFQPKTDAATPDKTPTTTTGQRTQTFGPIEGRPETKTQNPGHRATQRQAGRSISDTRKSGESPHHLAGEKTTHHTNLEKLRGELEFPFTEKTKNVVTATADGPSGLGAVYFFIFNPAHRTCFDTAVLDWDNQRERAGTLQAAQEDFTAAIDGSGDKPQPSPSERVFCVRCRQRVGSLYSWHPGLASGWCSRRQPHDGVTRTERRIHQEYSDNAAIQYRTQQTASNWWHDVTWLSRKKVTKRPSSQSQH